MMRQSPTMAVIRIQNRRWEEGKAPAPRVEVKRVERVAAPRTAPSKSPAFRVVVKVTASDRPRAVRHAVREAYRAIAAQDSISVAQFRKLQASLSGMSALLRTTSASVQELKQLQARVLQEQRSGQQVSVEVEVEQTVEGLTRDLRQFALANLRLVALLPEFVDGSPATMRRVESETVGALVQQKFRVYDAAYLNKQGLLKITPSVESQPEAVLTTAGSRCLANTVLTGRVETALSQETNGIVSYNATANLRVVKVSTGQVLLAQKWSERGFGQDRSQAANKSLDALAQTVAREFSAALQKRFEGFPITVAVASQHPEQLQEVERYLRGLSGVTSVEAVPQPEGMAYRVVSVEQLAAFGVQVEESGDYLVID